MRLAIATLLLSTATLAQAPAAPTGPAAEAQRSYADRAKLSLNWARRGQTGARSG